MISPAFVIEWLKALAANPTAFILGLTVGIGLGLAWRGNEIKVAKDSRDIEREATKAEKEALKAEREAVKAEKASLERDLKRCEKDFEAFKATMAPYTKATYLDDEDN